MRYYAIMCTDKPDSLEKRARHHTAYLARLDALQIEGRLLLAGPLLALDSEEISPKGFAGNLIVARFDSLDAAKTWLQEDPYMLADIYQQTNVQPFKPIAP